MNQKIESLSQGEEEEVEHRNRHVNGEGGKEVL